MRPHWRRGADIGSRGRTSVYADEAFVLKLFLVESDKPDRKIAGLEVAAQTGVRVPRLVWHGVLRGHRAVLLERLDGTQPQPRSDDEWIALSRATGEVARSLHVPVSAFGARSATPHRSISDALIHRGLSDRNVFGIPRRSGWELSAVIDCESSGGGLPEEEARWPALLELGGLRPPGTLAAFADGIGTAPDADVLAVFIVDLAVDIMSYAGHGNPQLMEAALTAARAIVT